MKETVTLDELVKIKYFDRCSLSQWYCWSIWCTEILNQAHHWTGCFYSCFALWCLRHGLARFWDMARSGSLERAASHLTNLPLLPCPCLISLRGFTLQAKLTTWRSSSSSRMPRWRERGQAAQDGNEYREYTHWSVLIFIDECQNVYHLKSCKKNRLVDHVDRKEPFLLPRPLITKMSQLFLLPLVNSFASNHGHCDVSKAEKGSYRVKIQTHGTISDKNEYRCHREAKDNGY